MAHPKRKHTRSRRDKRRANWKLKLTSLSTCSQCGTKIVPHRVCAHCGFYGGEQVVAVAEKSSKEKS